MLRFKMTLSYTIIVSIIISIITVGGLTTYSSSTVLSSRSINIANSLAPERQSVDINEDSNGKEIIMSRGQILNLALNKIDGYSWQMVRTPGSDILNDTYHQYGFQDVMIPSYWVYIAEGEGSTDIECTCNTGTAVNTFKITVKVVQPNNMAVVDNSFNGKELIVNKGEILKIALQKDIYNGHWAYYKTPDASILKETSSFSISYPSAPIPVPTGGSQVVSYWVFDTIGAGSTEIVYNYSNPWDMNTNEPVKTFTLKVNVTDKTAPSSQITYTPKPTATPIIYGEYALYGCIKPDLAASNQHVVNRSFMVEIVETGDFTFTDENGEFRFFPVTQNKVYTLRIVKDNYLTRTISAKVDTPTGTTEKPVIIWPGDLIIEGENDNAINMTDIVAMAKYFGKTSKDADFKASHDLNIDQAINMIDIVIIANHFNSVPDDYNRIDNAK